MPINISLTNAVFYLIVLISSIFVVKIYGLIAVPVALILNIFLLIRLFGFLTVTIVTLGFSSGLPLALTASTLSTYLKDYDVNLTAIGFIAAVSIPYSLKFLWSPLIDNLNVPVLSNYLGKRRGWLILTQALVALAIILMGVFNPANSLTSLVLTALALSFLSATQDIIIDAYRIELLSDEDQGIGAAAANFGYRIAILASTAMALFIAEKFSWQFSYLTMGLLIIPCMVVVLLNREPSHKTPEHNSYNDWINHAFVTPFKEFMRRKHWMWVVLFIALYKLGDAYLGAMTSPFLLDIGFTKIEIAEIVKIYGLIATLSGTFVGGYMIKKVGYAKSLIIGCILQMISNLVFIVQAVKGHDIYVLMCTMSVENFAGGIGSAALVAYISHLCNKEFTATQYALLSSLAAIGRTVVASSSGLAADFLGWIDFFILSAILSLPALMIAYFIFYKHNLEEHS